jgi:D-glycero-D-manno-heptose 1,7-bisphosphate phosphatase
MTTRPMKLVVLDRDGVINLDSDQYIKSPEEWKPIPGSLEAIARLTQAGFRVVVATNQSGLGRGLFDMATLNAMHDKMHKAVNQLGGRIDAVFFCPHAQDAGCDCRKPKPGMLREIAARFDLALTGVPVIGDSLRDLQAASAAGARPVLVLTGKGEQTLKSGGLPEGTEIHRDLAAAALALAA